jgi:amidohydrolase
MTTAGAWPPAISPDEETACMATVDELKTQAARLIDGELGRELVALADDLFAHPELRFEEHHAAATITALLERHGIRPMRGVAGLPTAFEARHGEANDGPTVAILAEYDALPGLGHACGHNVIAATGVGAFLALKRLGALPGNVRLYGTPGEEGGGGKIAMADAGAFAGCDAAMMIHPYGLSYPFVDLAGRVALRIVFEGRASHAAGAPEEGVNALDAAILFFNGTNAMRSRLRSDARLHGIIAEGGEAPNIVPARSRVEYYARAFDQAYLDQLVRDLRACAEGAARQTGCTVTVEPSSPAYDAFTTADPLAAAFAANLDRIGHPYRPERHRTLASSDIGNLSRYLPCIHPYLGMGDGLACHTVEFAQASGGEAGRRLVREGAKALAMTALDLLANPELLAATAAAHRG